MANTFILIGFIILLFLAGAIKAFIQGEFTDKNKKLLRDIRDELRKKNKNDESKEGKVIK